MRGSNYETLRTMEDLVALAVKRAERLALVKSNPNGADDTKWRLERSGHFEWDDKAAGDRWEEEKVDLIHDTPDEVKRSMNTLGLFQTKGANTTAEEKELAAKKDEYQKKSEELKSRRPPEHRVDFFFLSAQNPTRGASTYYLSPELFATLDSVWTKRKNSWGEGEKRVGALTLAGMFKRLGKIQDVAAAVTIAREHVLAEQAKTAMTLRRRAIREKAQELLDLITAAPAGTVPYEPSSDGIVGALLGLLAVVSEKKEEKENGGT